MNLKNHKLLIVIVLAVTITLIPIVLGIVHITTGVSIAQTILYAFETEDADDNPETDETEDSPATEEPADPDYPEKKGLDVNLYKKARNIVYDDVPDDFRLSNLSSEIISLDSWSPKSWALMYLLAAEICMRDEINPDDAEVVIRPEYLIGEMNMESTYDGSDRIRDLIPKDTYCTWVDSSHIDLSAIVAVEPLGQFINLYSVGDSAIGCIYISEMENPSLAADKRAIVGSRSDIYSGNGKYMDAKRWTADLRSLKTASIAEIKNNMKLGVFDQNGLTYQARPACYYLPDAFYSHALGLRAALNGMTYNQAVTGYGSDPNVSAVPALAECKTNNTTDKVLREVMVAAAMGQYVGSNMTGFLDPSYDYIGALYQRMIACNVSPVTYKNLIKLPDVTSTSLTRLGSGNVCAMTYTGLPSSTATACLTSFEAAETYTWPDFVFNEDVGSLYNKCLQLFMNYETLSAYRFGDTQKQQISTGIFGELLRAELSVCASLEDEQSQYTRQLEIGQFFSRYSSAAGTWHSTYTRSDLSTYPYYGMASINIGTMTLTTMEECIEELYALYPKKSASSAEFITGTDCLGDTCKHDFAESTLHISYYYEMDSSKYKSLMINQETVTDLFSDIDCKGIVCKAGEALYYGSYVTGYRNTLAGIHKPINDNLYYSTYSYPIHAGVDITSDGGILNQEIHPIANGVIVAMFSYPYDVGKARINAGESSLSFSGGTWVGMGGYGNSILVLHKAQSGNYFYSMYAHMDSFAHVDVGCAVSPKTVLGYGGTTGKSTGPHLHLEVRLLSETPAGTYTHPYNFTRSDYIQSALEKETS